MCIRDRSRGGKSLWDMWDIRLWTTRWKCVGLFYLYRCPDDLKVWNSLGINRGDASSLGYFNFVLFSDLRASRTYLFFWQWKSASVYQHSIVKKLPSSYASFLFGCLHLSHRSLQPWNPAVRPFAILQSTSSQSDIHFCVSALPWSDSFRTVNGNPFDHSFIRHLVVHPLHLAGVPTAWCNGASRTTVIGGCLLYTSRCV